MEWEAVLVLAILGIFLLQFENPFLLYLLLAIALVALLSGESPSVGGGAGGKSFADSSNWDSNATGHGVLRKWLGGFVNVVMGIFKWIRRLFGF